MVDRRIIGLGHTGVWVHDLEIMRKFYVEVLGLTVTDEDDERGIVFLSSRPLDEHHEMVLQRGRVGGAESKVVNQISWRLASIEDLQYFDRTLEDGGVKIQQKVTHGNALGIYFFDPEGNRLEVYWATGDDVPQPFRKSIDLQGRADQLLAESRKLVEEGGNPYQPVQ